MKKISVILPCYNGEQWIGSSIRSVLGQSIQEFELIIIDDGSTDKSYDAVFPFLKDNRVRYFYQTNKGFSSAINRGIQESNCDLICFIGQDDLYIYNKLELQLKYLDSNPNVDLIHSSYIEINEKEESLCIRNNHFPEFDTPAELITSLFIQNFIGFETVLIKRKCFEKYGLFDEQLTGFSDHDMWIRIAGGIKIGYVYYSLVKKRVHKNQLSNAKASVIKDEFLLSKKAIEYYPFLNQSLKKKIAMLYYETGIALLKEQKFKESKTNLKKALKYQPFKLTANIAYFFPRPFLFILKQLVKC